MQLFAIFTSEEYINKSHNTKFIKIINGFFIKIIKGFYSKSITMLGEVRDIIKWNYPKDFKREELTIRDEFIA